MCMHWLPVSCSGSPHKVLHSTSYLQHMFAMTSVWVPSWLLLTGQLIAARQISPSFGRNAISGPQFYKGLKKVQLAFVQHRHTHTHTHRCTHTQTHTHTDTCTHRHTHTCTQTHTHTYTQSHMHTYTMHAHARTSIHTRAHTCTHVIAHTLTVYIHTHTYTPTQIMLHSDWSAASGHPRPLGSGILCVVWSHWPVHHHCELYCVWSCCCVVMATVVYGLNILQYIL